jgi:hypothetical protein
MPSKEVGDRLEAAEAVTRATEDHADAIGDKLTDMLEPFSRRGDVIPDVGTAMVLLGRRLKSLGEAMRAAEKASEDEAATAAERAAALDRKRAAIDEYDAAFGDTTLMVALLLRTVGEDALAMKMRPSSVRPGRMSAGDDEPAKRETK